MKKRLPIGVNDFKKMIEGNYYYLDKTGFVDEVLNRKYSVELIARPKKFGKYPVIFLSLEDINTETYEDFF